MNTNFRFVDQDRRASAYLFATRFILRFGNSTINLSILFALLLSLTGGIFNVLPAQAAVSNDSWWTWVDGSNTVGQLGTYGIEDIPADANVPGAREFAVSWTDGSGSLWLFGGYAGWDNSAGTTSFLNDLWKFNPGTGQWTWVDGSTLSNQYGIYGIEDTPAATNVPGARDSATSWTDGSGNLWLFGGTGYDSANTFSNYLNDLWKFNPDTGQWTWVDGSKTGNQSGTYGIEDTPAAANVPGGRYGAVSWIDGSGNLWLFGGSGNDSAGTTGHLNDLWKFNPGTGQWTWVDGSNTVNQSGIYGSEDTPAAANVPGARDRAVSWIDGSGNLWLFGGYGIGASNNLNDLWKFNPGTGQWTWVDGSNTKNQSGIYGIEDTPAAANVPGARGFAVSWIDGSGNLWLFGGNGYDGAGATGYLNDLWKFNPGIGQWNWADGSNTVSQSGTYGSEDIRAAANVPGARSSAVSWVDGSGDIWLFGGNGYDAAGAFGYLNDLWKFSALIQNGPNFVVNTNADTDDGTCSEDDCTLREAISAANAHAGADTIHFAGNYTIVTGSQLPNITDDIWIIDGEYHAIVIDGALTFRVFTVDAGVTVALRSLTIRNGYTPDNGGAILNNGTLSLLNDTFTGNTAAGFGGAIDNNGTLTVSNSTFTSNTATVSNGGAIANHGSAILTISNSTFNGNQAGSFGGGIYEESGSVTIINSTFSGNSSAFHRYVGNTTIRNTIFAASTNADCTDTYPGGYVAEIFTNNLITDTGSDACGMVNGANGNIIGNAPNLGALTGSPAFFPLNTGSPAIDKGNNAICAAAPVSNTSQNGVNRPQDGDVNGSVVCDIGSYEKAGGTERAKNGGFNTYIGASKIPQFWVKSTTFAATDGKDTTVKKEGAASVKIVGAAGKTKTLTQTLNLSGLTGDKLTFSFWAKGASIPAAGICRAQVLLYDGATLKLTKTVNCSNGTYAAFQKKALSFNATSNFTKVIIRFTYSKASGTVWFDLVSLVK